MKYCFAVKQCSRSIALVEITKQWTYWKINYLETKTKLVKLQYKGHLMVFGHNNK